MEKLKACDAQNKLLNSQVKELEQKEEIELYSLLKNAEGKR